MIPLETLDQYMTLVVAVGGVYLVFMLFLLVCFLRKFNTDPVDSLICQRPIELRTISNPYRYCNVNQNITQPPSYTSRSNRSYSSRNSSNVCKIQMKKIAYGRIDLSQMERNNEIYHRSSPFQTNYSKCSQSLKKQKHQFSFISNKISPSDIKVTGRSNHAKSFPSKMVFSTAVCRKFHSNISSSDQLKQDISPRFMLSADENNNWNLLTSNSNIACNKSPDFYHSDINFTSRYSLNHQKIQLNSANKKNGSNVLKSLHADDNLDFYRSKLREVEEKEWNNKSICYNQLLPKFQFPFQNSHSNIQCMTDIVNLNSFYSNSDSNKKISLNKTSTPLINKKGFSQPLKSVKTKENFNQKLFITSDDFLTTNRSNFGITPLRNHCLLSSSNSESILSDSDINVIENKKDFVLNVCKDSFCDDFFMKMSALELLSRQKSSSLSEISNSEASLISNVNCINDRSCLCKVCVSRTFSCVDETGNNYCEIVSDYENYLDDNSVMEEGDDDVDDNDDDSVVEEGDVDHEHMLQNRSFSESSSIISVDSYYDSDVQCIENNEFSNTDEKGCDGEEDTIQ